jgi:hypothetical protein
VREGEQPGGSGRAAPVRVLLHPFSMLLDAAVVKSEPIAAASAVALRHISDEEAGGWRGRRGRRFSYVDARRPPAARSRDAGADPRAGDPAGVERAQLRVGNDEYARQSRSYGATTLRDRHAKIRGDTLERAARRRRA